jgi:hypothetical protein
MRKNLSKKKDAKVTSYNQLDFAWSQPSRKSNELDNAMGATDSYTTGHLSSRNPEKRDRLFVPLASEPFYWFLGGRKRWELRRLGRQYTPRHVKVGRPVELRRGYSSKQALWGRITNVVQADDLCEFFQKVPYQQVIPVAQSLDEAIGIANSILDLKENTRVLGFEIGIISEKTAPLT